MLSKKITKRLVGLVIMLFTSVSVFNHYGQVSHSVPAVKDKYTEGDRQFTINLSTTESPAGSNPGAVDFNGNGTYDDSEMLDLKGTEDFVISKSAQIKDEKSLSLKGIEGHILRSNSVVVREDVKDYQKAYLRDGSSGGYLYLKVGLEGSFKESVKSFLDKAVEEYNKNKGLLENGKGSEISLLAQENLATIIMNSLGMKNQDGSLANKDFKLAVSYKTGSKSDVKKIDVLDIVMDTTMSKKNQYTNSYNAPKIVDKEGNIYLKVYGFPSGTEVTGVAIEGDLVLPIKLEKSVASTLAKQKEIDTQKGIIPFIDPMLTENVNKDNANPLDPLALKPTVSYLVDISLNKDGELTSDPDGVIEYMGPFSEDDAGAGYEHANIRPVDTGIAFYDAIYDPENTIKRLEIKDDKGKTYVGKLLKEEKKIGSFQNYAELDQSVRMSDTEKNSAQYKDILIEGLKPGTIYKFTELSVIFNSGDGDVKRRFTNYDTISTNPLGIRTMGDLSGSEGDGSDLLETLDIVKITPTKLEIKVGVNDPDGIIKNIRIDGDSIAQSLYDSKTGVIQLFGITPNNVNSGLELVVELVNGEELALELDEFKTPKVKNSKEWIEGFYNIFFLRDGDESGMAYWSSNLGSHQMSVNYFTANIVNENEYKEKNLDNKKYVERMYRSVTGRTSDEQGLAWWTQTLEQTITKLGDRTAAMQEISARMLGEAETRNFLTSLGMKVD